MKNTFAIRLFVLWVLTAALFVSAAIPALAEDYSASTIRLEHFEGDVEIEDAEGNPRFFMEGVRLASGDVMTTGAESTASVSLDASKILTVDQESQVKFTKQGGALTLTLNKGALLLDVQEKLDENETLDIQTSTMTVGIRGTIIGVSVEDVLHEDASAIQEILNKASALDAKTGDKADTIVLDTQADGAGSKYSDVSFNVSSVDTLLLRGEDPVLGDSERLQLGALLVMNGVDESVADQLLAVKDGAVPGIGTVRELLEVFYPSGIIPLSGTSALQSDAALGTNQVTTVYVLEGTGNLSYVDENNVEQSITLTSGQKATLVDRNENSLVDVAPTTSDMTDEDLEGFLNTQLEISPAMTSRVQAASSLLDYPYDADGNWTVTSKVTMAAQSASKMYDGTPLTRFGGVLVVGVPAALDVTVFANGKQVDAGSSENAISQYAIYNKKGENVTDHFAEIELISGTLVVDPAPVTIWTGSAKKPYDGTPLTCDEVEIHTVQGYEAGEPAWRNTSSVITEGEGLEALYGLSGVTWAHGTNPLTGETMEIAVSVGEKMTVYLNDTEEGGQSIEFRVESVSEDEIPESILRMYGENPALFAQACEDAGWDPAVIRARIAALSSKGKTVAQQDGLLIDAAEKNRIMREFTNVRITVDTDYDYADSPLNNDEASYTRVDLNQAITVTVNGSQTDVGESKNTYVIDWGSVNPYNYILTDDLGILTVTPNEDEIVFTGESASKTYDGQPLTAEVTVSGLPAGLTYEAQANGSQTDAGASENCVDSYRILDGKNKDVTEFFTGITTENGTLTVTPAPAAVTTGSAEKPYDGKPLTSEEAYITGLVDGDYANVIANGTITDPGTADNTYTIDWGYTKAENYDITEMLGTLTITVNTTPVTFTAGSAEKIYDGAPLTNDEVTVEGLPDGFTFAAVAKGSQTNAGKNENAVASYKIFNASGAEVTASFINATTVNGALTVTPASVKVTTGSAEKVYDGEALTGVAGSITGLVSGETVTIIPTGSITEVGTADNTYEIDWGAVKRENYTVADELGVLTVTPLELSLDLGSVNADYTGSPILPEPTLTYLNGEHAGETVGASFLSGGVPGARGILASAQAGAVGRRQAVSGSLFRFTLFTGDIVDVTISGMDAGVGSYTLSADVSFSSVGNITCESAAATGATLTVNPVPLTIKTSSADKPYDGSPLTSAAVTIEGLRGSDAITVNATGTITNVGEANNTYEIIWGDTDPGNYVVTDELGTLTVNVNTEPITFIAASADKIYDGEPLTNEEVTVKGLPDGFTFTATADGSQTDVGSSTNTVASYHILDAGGADVTESFVNISTTAGTLSVSPASLTITTESAGKPYDGTALTAPVSQTGLTSADAEVVTITATGTITNVGTAENTYEIAWNAVKSTNYTLTEDLGTLEVTINDVEITFTAASGEKVYDGEALTSDEVTVVGLPEGITFEAETSGSQTAAGASENTVASYKILDGESQDVTAYFSNVTTVAGTLTVQPQSIAITTGSAEKVFDGTPLIGSAVITGLTSEDQARVTITTASITNAGVVSNDYAIDWGGADASNYTIIEETVGTLTVTPLPVYISVSDYSYPYRGYYQASIPTVTSDNPNFTVIGDDWIREDQYNRWHIAWAWGDQLDFGVSGGLDVGSYSCYVSEVTASSGDVNNYAVTVIGSPTSYNVYKLSLIFNFNATTLSRTFAEAEPELAITAQYGNGVKGGHYFDPDSVALSGDTMTLHYSLVTNEELILTITGLDDNAGTHTLEYSCEIVGGSGALSNYSISATNKSYTISPLPVTITLSDENYPYCGQYQGCPPTITCDNPNFTRNGSWLSDDEYIHWHINWAWGDQLDFDVNGGLNVGNYTCSIGEVTASSGNVNNYDITVGGPANKNIYKMQVIFDCDPDPWEYVYGETISLPAQPDAFYNNSIHGGWHISPDSISSTGTSLTARYTLFTGDEIEIKASLDGHYNVGYHHVSTSYSVVKGDPANFSISVSGMYEITPAPVTVTTNSASKNYDGAPLVGSVTVEGLVGDPDVYYPADQLPVFTASSYTDAGSYTNNYTVDWRGYNAGNYTITENLGTLTIRRKIEIDLCGDYTWYHDPEGVIPIVYVDGCESVECEFLTVQYTTNYIRREYRFTIPLEDRGPLYLVVYFRSNYWSGGTNVWDMDGSIEWDSSTWDSNLFYETYRDTTIHFTPAD